MARLTLQTRNAKGVIANIFAVDRQVAAAIKRTVRDTGFAEYELAYGLTAVDTGMTRDALTLEFLPSELGYELGWKEADFAAVGRAFVPVFLEFGTSKMPAQPALFPARDAVRPRFDAALRRNIQTAIRRRAKVSA